MTDKEKAKAYDMALEIAKNEINIKGIGETVELCERLFPELRESEDERIRKEIIEFISWAELRGSVRADWHQKKCPGNWIAYLEKQKEPHYTKRNALFDKCVENCDPKVKVMKEVSDKVDEMLGKEQKPAEWNEATINGEPIPIENQSVDIPLSKWSEEDEKAFKRAIDCVRSWEIDYCDGDNRISERLKSLHPSWKPSEEQMKALYCALCEEISRTHFDALESLYNDLKKLM